MTWKPVYATVDELKAQLRIGDTVDDDALAVALEAASRAIDQATNRQFGVVDSPVTNFYTDACTVLENRRALPIDDLMNTSGLTVKFDSTGLGAYTETVVSGTDFDLWPWNAVVNGVPYTHLVMRPQSTFWLPGWTRAVSVTATFGWSDVPAVVKQACLITAARLFVRRDSAYGVAGSPDMGSQIRLLSSLDPDVQVLLQVVKRRWGAV